MKTISFLTLFLLGSLAVHAGVYATLEFGDDRQTVTRKLQASSLVEQTIDNTFLARTGLNGIFKCKNKLAGLNYRLFFNWTEEGGLKEITLQSDELDAEEYHTTLKQAWQQARNLFTQVYNTPAQESKFPAKSAFKKHNVLISLVWHKGDKQSILVGPGFSKKGKCFLVIRFVNEHLELPPLSPNSPPPSAP